MRLFLASAVVLTLVLNGAAPVAALFVGACAILAAASWAGGQVWPRMPVSNILPERWRGRITRGP